MPSRPPALYPESKIEVRGFSARHYDLLLDIATCGEYKRFIEKAIAWMGIWPSDRIIDLGAGTGRNACLMARYLNESGRIVGVDIGHEMAAQFRKRCGRYPNITLLQQRIDLPLTLDEKFDKALLSFVLHGFPQQAREAILDNCFRLLDPGGELILIDYNTLSLEALPWYLRLPFKLVECPYAFEFIQMNLTEFLLRHGFASKQTRLFFKGMIRCLRATRIEA